MTDRVSLEVNQERDATLLQARLVHYAISALMFLALATFVFDGLRRIYQWLRFGETAPSKLHTWIDMPSVSWAGVQKIISYIWDTDLLITAPIVTVLASFFAAMSHLHVEELKKVPRLGKGKESAVK